MYSGTALESTNWHIKSFLNVLDLLHEAPNAPVLPCNGFSAPSGCSLGSGRPLCHSARSFDREVKDPAPRIGHYKAMTCSKTGNLEEKPCICLLVTQCSVFSNFPGEIQTRDITARKSEGLLSPAACESQQLESRQP